jgi:hypothetical protein
MENGGVIMAGKTTPKTGKSNKKPKQNKDKK